MAGDGSEALATSVRARYPVALIDEFQDIDPQQYRIFRRLYGDQPDCGLFLIGDPKQAIYAFRGADIFTYMQARDDSARAGHRYSLTVNQCSGSRLIEAVNCLFAPAQAPFIYQDYIGFEPVALGPTADERPLRIQGVEPVPLQFWMLQINQENQTRKTPVSIRADAALTEAAQACAGYIADLLDQADAGAVTIGDSALKPSDIALLVRTHREGDLVQQALRACGISSVSLSEDSVFATEDAEELTTLLQALAAPHDAGRVRAALATTLLGRNAADLAQLSDDGPAWEELLTRFRSYRDCWQQQGIMVALQTLLAAERIPARLLRRPNGERRLTNLLHRNPESELPTSRIARLSEAEIRADLDTLAARAPDAIEIRALPLPGGGPWLEGRIAPARLTPREFRSTINAGWRVASYSGLVRGDESERPDFDAAAVLPVPEAEPGDPTDPVFALPAGTQAGRFLHQLFQDLDFPHAAGEALTRTVRDLLDRYGGLGTGRAADRDWTPVVEALVTNVLEIWLDPAASLRLRDIAAADRILELEFHFPLAGLSPESLSAALAVSEARADAAAGLGFEPMHGLMHGFIDLVFRYQGRFYIVDYKSNRLGDRLPAYGQDGLRVAVRHHRYQLQYLIYTLALHRFLGWRLPGYDYQTHCGGVYYLFLRGMRPHTGPRYGVWYDRPSCDLIEALDRLFGGGQDLS